MAIKSVTYNGFSFQDSNWRTKDVIYRGLPHKILDMEPLSRRDGFRLINSYYTDKDITISGNVATDTEANLRILVQAMKEAVDTDQANLDIDDDGTTVRWNATVANIDVPEEHFHITRIPFSVTFKCQPFGKLTSSTQIANSITNASASPFLGTFDPIGSAPPRPILKWVVSGTPTTPITSITFTNTTTGDAITVANLLLNSNSDYLVIDCEAMTVKRSYDGGAETNIDFTGTIPNFIPGSNSYSVAHVGGSTTWTLNQTITYFASHL